MDPNVNDFQKKIIVDTRRFLAERLRDQFREKRKNFTLIGITGTNGKTTSTFLIHQALNLLGKKAAYLGNLGLIIDNVLTHKHSITTPDFTLIYKLMDQLIDNNIMALSMESSAQGLIGGQLEKMEYDYVGFTNLTLDHLDYFKTMKKYENAKLKLFKEPRDKSLFAVINGDDPNYKDFCFEKNKNVLYGEKPHNDFIIENCKLYPSSSEFTVAHNGKKYDVKLSIPGKYNIYNYMNTFIILNDMGYSFEDIISISDKLTAPLGRFQTFKYKGATVIIDYAHTPDGVENIISNVLKMKKNKVYTVIGCGGDRDRTKRPIMGELATSLSDFVIFTNDNPRTEDEKRIMHDIVSPLKNKNYIIEYDRKKAIESGMDMLKEGDVLLVLGKGHEDYQILKTGTIHYSDIETVENKINNT